MNRTGTVTGVNGTLCNITLDNGEKSSSIFWMLRAAGTAPADTGTLVTGTYKCYSLTGSTTNYMFMDVRIDSGTTYQDTGGKSGR